MYLNNLKNKFVKVITFYGEELIGIVIREPIVDLHLKTYHGLIVLDLCDVADIIIIGEIVGDNNV